MKTRTALITSLSLIVLSLATALWFYPGLPDKMVTHWGLNGSPNGFSSKAFAVWFMPMLEILLLAVFLSIPKLDPKKQNIESFRGSFNMFTFGIVAFLTYIYALSLIYNLGYVFSLARLLSPAFGLLFYMVGLLMEKAKQNWFIGIRTPWTLESENVWNKTHALAGKLFKAAAMVSLLGLVLKDYGLLAGLASVLIAAIWSMTYSYFFKKENRTPNL